jgi:hypothetical protein
MSRLTAVVDSDVAETDPTDAAPPPEPAAPQEPEPAEPAPKEASSDPAELTAEDLAEDAPPVPPSGDSFEIVHNGTQHKLSREETIKYAQQGFDYTQKTQALSEKGKALEAALQNAAEVEQMMPMLANEQAQFAAMQSQLAQWKDVDWVKLATDAPLEYPKFRAQYDQLLNGANRAAQQLNHAVNLVQGKRKEAQGAILREQFQKLTNDYVPEWKDPAKYQAGAQELSQYLINEGADPAEVAQLSSALSIKIALKAMKYDRAMASKQSKSKLLQTAPPVARPGVNPSQANVQGDKEQQAAKRFKKSGSLEDAAALYMHRLK